MTNNRNNKTNCYPVLYYIFTLTVWIAFVAMMVWLIFGSISRCSAQYDETTALHLVQCIVSECDACDRYPQEPLAIAWVLKKRMEMYNANPRNKVKRTLNDQILAYCALFDRRSNVYYGTRARNIRSSTFEHSNHLPMQHWNEIYNIIQRFFYGSRDPLPLAMHWGGHMDTRRARRAKWVVVARWSNIFYRYR